MKKKNCRCEFASHRSRVLLQNFRDSIARQSRISAIKAFKEAAEAPAPRFWVSEARAVRIIQFLLKDEMEILDTMRPEKRAMYLEILNRVKLLKASNPDMALGDLVFEVVNNPAPRSFLSWQYASKIIRNNKL